MTRYRCVAARKAEGFNVIDACDAAGVSRSAFYAWLERGEGPTDAEWDEARLINEIRDLHAASDGTYGEPRMTAELADKGWVINRKRTARLMRENRLQGYRPRRRRSLTKADEAAPTIPDLVGRRFQPALLDTVWCGDITYLRTVLKTVNTNYEPRLGLRINDLFEENRFLEHEFALNEFKQEFMDEVQADKRRNMN